jgi:predicted negative regulator of RcsB-dependent stress response
MHWEHKVPFAPVVGFGWRWYNEHHERQNIAASVLYNHLMNDALSGTVPKPVDVAIMQRFKKDYPTSTYRELAELFSARQAVEKGDLPQAEQILQSAVHGGANPALIDLARLRLARVQIAQAQPQRAVKTLQGISQKASGLMQMAANIERANAYVALKQNDKAQQLMSQVMAQAKSAGVEVPGFALG